MSEVTTEPIFVKTGAEERYHRTEVIQFDAINYDAEANVLRDVVVCRAGIAKGHGTELDQAFVEAVVEMGNQYSEGLKSRFGHPNMSTESLGTYVGRLKEFKVDGNTARANLYLDPVSKSAPQGNLHDWIISMANSNQDMLGMSIVFKPGDLFQLDDEGKKRTVTSSEQYDRSRPLFETIEELFGCDLVDDPAAAESLFSAKFNADKFAVQVTEFLDSHPQIWDAINKNPGLIDRFKAKYEQYFMKKPKKELSAKAKAAIEALAKKQFDITADTTDGEVIHIITAGTDPAVGDQVNIVNADGTETPAPDNTYVINDGPYDGWTCVVAAGMITEVTTADAIAPDTTVPPATVSAAAKDDELKMLQQQLQELKDKIENTAAAPATVVAEDGDVNFLESTEEKLSPWNKEGLKIFNSYKNLKPAMVSEN